MYNRIRSQTISTRYLCVSGNASTFPTFDWRLLTNEESLPFAIDQSGACFVARTNGWDPYVVRSTAHTTADPRRSTSSIR